LVAPGPMEWQGRHFLNTLAPFSTSCAKVAPVEAAINTAVTANLVAITDPFARRHPHACGRKPAQAVEAAAAQSVNGQLRPPLPRIGARLTGDTAAIFAIITARNAGTADPLRMPIAVPQHNGAVLARHAEISTKQSRFAWTNLHCFADPVLGWPPRAIVRPACERTIARGWQ